MTLNSTQKRVLASHHFDFGQVDDMLPYTLLPFDSNVEMATQSLAFSYLCDATEFESSMLDFELFMGELEITVHKQMTFLPANTFATMLLFMLLFILLIE